VQGDVVRRPFTASASRESAPIRHARMHSVNRSTVTYMCIRPRRLLTEGKAG